MPHGVLLVGPPGTGKTLIARAVAGEAEVPFYSISGSDFGKCLSALALHVCAICLSRLKRTRPCIIFIDEIDAVGRHRGAGLGGGNDEREQTLNQLLVEMDGFETNEGIILIAAPTVRTFLTRRSCAPAVLTVRLFVSNPDIVGREAILKVHIKNVPLAPNVDLRVIARGTPGFSGADLMNLVNEAALLAARREKRMVTAQEFDDRKRQVDDGR